MRAMRSTLVLLLLASVAPAADNAPCTSSTGRTVSMTGSAAVRLPPDRVSFTVGVEAGSEQVPFSLSVIFELR